MKENIVIIPRHDYDAMVEKCRILDSELKDIISGEKGFFTNSSLLEKNYRVVEREEVVLEMRQHIRKLEDENRDKSREISLLRDRHERILRKINNSSFGVRLKYLFTRRLGK